MAQCGIHNNSKVLPGMVEKRALHRQANQQREFAVVLVSSLPAASACAARS